jgi:hypothetical protein
MKGDICIKTHNGFYRVGNERPFHNNYPCTPLTTGTYTITLME